MRASILAGPALAAAVTLAACGSAGAGHRCLTEAGLDAIIA